MAKKKTSKLAAGKTQIRIVSKGPNKGQKVLFRGSPSGKPFPVRVLSKKAKRVVVRGDNKGKKKKVGKKGNVNRR